MTESEFTKNLDELLKSSLITQLRTECLRKARSGGVDLAEFDDDYVLPKICLSLALAELADQYAPSKSQTGYREIWKNLSHF